MTALAADDPRLDSGLRSYLAHRFPGQSAVLRVHALAGDASTRRYFRIEGEGLTYVLALYPEPFVAQELSFIAVRRVLARCGLPVPEIEHADGARGILLQQDLGDTTLQEVLRAGPVAEHEALYDEALDQLVQLQREAARGPQDAVCFQLAFDVSKLCFELQHFVTHFVLGHRACVLAADERATLAAAFQRLCEEIASWPRVLCHRDYHSRNLMPHAGRLHWVDFQDARMGPATYDLASLLRDSYVDLGEDFVSERAAKFGERALPRELAATHAHRFELMCVQRNLKALGTFGYMHNVRGSDVYLPYIPRTLAHVRRHLERHSELLSLRQVLGRHIAELA